MLPDHLDFFGSQFLLSSRVGLPQNLLSDGVVTSNILGEILEVSVDDLNIWTSEIAVAAVAVLPDVNLSGRVGDHVDLLHRQSGVVGSGWPTVFIESPLILSSLQVLRTRKRLSLNQLEADFVAIEVDVTSH